MNDAAEKVLNLVEERIGHYEDLKTLMTGERKPLIDVDLEGLQEMAGKKEKTIKAIQDQTEDMADSIKNLAGLLDCPADPLPHLSQLAEHLGRPIGNRFRTASMNLARIKSEVHRHNLDHQEFVQSALGLINDSIGALTGIRPTVADSYQADGQQVLNKPLQPVKLNREI